MYSEVRSVLVCVYVLHHLVVVRLRVFVSLDAFVRALRAHDGVVVVKDANDRAFLVVSISIRVSTPHERRKGRRQYKWMSGMR